MSQGAVEIISGRERRRRWSLEEKLRIVGYTHERGACVRAVAARHNVYPSLLHSWRRQVREGRLGAAPSSFVPVRPRETQLPEQPPLPQAERSYADRREIKRSTGSELDPRSAWRHCVA